MSLLKQNILVIFLISLVLFSNSIMAEILFTHKGDSIAYDETNNHYIMTYVGLQGEIKEVIWHPPTDINVEVESDYEVAEKGMIEYEYEFEVDKTSKLAFDLFYLYAIDVDKNSLQSPGQWEVVVSDAYEVSNPTQRFGWFTVTKQIQAGDEVEGFEFQSSALPVFDKLFISGKTDTLTYDEDDGPNVETQSYFQNEILSKHINGKGIYTAIPLIPVSEPFNAVETYTSFHSFLLGYIKKGFIDPSIVISLTDTSTAVLTALTTNDINGALTNLKAVKKLVEGEDENHKYEKGHDEGEKGKPQSLILKDLRKILKFNIKFIKKKLNS